MNKLKADTIAEITKNEDLYLLETEHGNFIWDKRGNKNRVESCESSSVKWAFENGSPEGTYYCAASLSMILDEDTQFIGKHFESDDFKLKCFCYNTGIGVYIVTAFDSEKAKKIIKSKNPKITKILDLELIPIDCKNQGLLEIFVNDNY